MLLWCDTALTCEATLERDLTFSRSLVPEDRSRTASLSPTTAMEVADGSGGGGTAIGGFEDDTVREDSYNDTWIVNTSIDSARAPGK